MEIRLPDPHPGRCLNYREGRGRCLDYEGHNSRCRFPDPPRPLSEPTTYTQTTGTPEPWVSPLEDGNL